MPSSYFISFDAASPRWFSLRQARCSAIIFHWFSVYAIDFFFFFFFFFHAIDSFFEFSTDRLTAVSAARFSFSSFFAAAVFHAIAAAAVAAAFFSFRHADTSAHFRRLALAASLPGFRRFDAVSRRRLRRLAGWPAFAAFAAVSFVVSAFAWFA